MKKHLLLTLSFCLFTIFSFSQYKFEVGVEASATDLNYRIEDAGKNLENVPGLSGIGGVNFRINTKKKFFYEAALLFTEYAQGIKFRQESGYAYSNSDEVMLLPLRVGYYIRLSSRISLVPVVGAVPGLVLFSQDGSYSSMSTSINATSYDYEYEARELYRKFMFLLQGGLGLDFLIAKRVGLTFSPAYYLGLRTTKIFDVRYQIGNNPVQTATMYGKGSFVSYGVSARYLFGRNRKN